MSEFSLKKKKKEQQIAPAFTWKMGRNLVGGSVRETNSVRIPGSLTQQHVNFLLDPFFVVRSVGVCGLLIH